MLCVTRYALRVTRQSMNNELDTFINELIKQAGLDNMPEDFKDEYRDKLAQEAQKRLGVASMALLTMEQIEELNGIIEKEAEPAEAIKVFLTAHIPDYTVKMAEALKEFGREVLEAAGK